MTLKTIGLAAGGLVLLAILATAALLTTRGGASTAPTAAGVNSPVLQATGKITALQASGFTLTPPNHIPYTVTVGNASWIVVTKDRQRVTGTRADLQVGDTVTVAGSPRGADGVDAQVVLPVAAVAAAPAHTPGAGKGRQPGAHATTTPGAARTPGAAAATTPGAEPTARVAKLPRRDSLFGPAAGRATVQAVADGVLTLQMPGSTKPVQMATDAGTLVIKGGLATLGDLKPGDTVEVRPRRLPGAIDSPTPVAPGATGTPPVAAGGKAGKGKAANAQRGSSKAPIAALIYVPAPGHMLTSGRVKTTAAGQFTILTFGGDYSFTTSADTRFEVLGDAGMPAAGQAGDMTPEARLFVYAPQAAAGAPAPASVVIIETGLKP